MREVLKVSKEFCVSCHKCISVCPVKYANDGSGNYVILNNDLCIACGECLHACTHGARVIIDDFEALVLSLQKKESVIAIVAPAIAATFPERYLEFNGWLKQIGVKAIFDVSFGAELTVKSYLDYIKKENPSCVIAQPCPAIVNYIETYQPELIPYLAPKDSPMTHTMKMIDKYYPQYKGHKILVISPCIAKKREFEEVGFGDFNVTLATIKKYFDKKGVFLDKYPKVDYDNPPSERAVTFSMPGGLMLTALREDENLSDSIRKIEGVSVVYKYFKNLNKMIKEGKAPILIDCLNCDAGCNAGTGTLNHEKSIDELEFYIKERAKTMMKKYKNELGKTDKESLNRILDGFYDSELYNRKYKDRSENQVKYPNESELKVIYNTMGKYEDADFKNCASCGYNTCEGMAIAIFNNLNKKENCHFFNSAKKGGDKIQAESQFKLGKLFESQEKYDKAISYFENAIRLDETNGGYYIQLANLYKKISKLENAVNVYSQYLKNVSGISNKEEIEKEIEKLNGFIYQ
ncbi:tetratricopeptide repeat protein [bacterium]|nr:tetratricopeptide repeat protein [bacterium]